MEAGLVSQVSGPADNDLGVEVASVGREGMVGTEALFDLPPIAFFRTVALTSGSAWRMPVEDLHDAIRELPALRVAGVRYNRFAIIMSNQGIACQAMHTLSQRTARWLLHAHDRIGADALEITQEWLAEILGVTRPGVSQAASKFQDAGLINYRRGRLNVVNRAGLEREACACYHMISNEYERLLPNQTAPLPAAAN